MGGWIQEHDGAVLLGQLVVWLGCLIWAAPELRRAAQEQPRWLKAALPIVGLGAAAISLFWFPAFDRFTSLGHEASYFDCYTGASPPGHEGGWEPYVTYPLLRWLYWALGQILPGQTPTAPLVLSALARGVGVVLIGGVGAVLGRRPEVGLAAALLLAGHSVHAFWGAGLYNVPVPHAFVLLCLLLALLAWRSGSVATMCAAAASGSLVVAGRVEWGLLAPSLAVLLATLGPAWGRSDRVKRPGFWLAPLGLAAAYGLTLFLGEGQLTEQGGYHGVRGYLVTIQHQVGLLEIFEPLHRWWALLGAAVGGFLWWKRGDVGAFGPLGLLAFAAVGWVGIATFNDASYRHALLPGVALVLGLALLAPALRGPRPVAIAAALLLAATAVGEASALRTSAHRYYMSAEAFADDHRGFDGPELQPVDLETSGCFLITDDERLWRMGLAGSHFNLMDPGEAVKRWRHHGGCIDWLYDASNHRHDGLAARVRGRKLLRWFSWQERGFVRFPGGLDAVVYRMTSPPWGVQDDEPIPPTDVLMPWEQEAEEDEEPEQGGEGDGEPHDEPADR